MAFSAFVRWDAKRKAVTGGWVREGGSNWTALAQARREEALHFGKLGWRAKKRGQST